MTYSDNLDLSVRLCKCGARLRKRRQLCDLCRARNALRSQTKANAKRDAKRKAMNATLIEPKMGGHYNLTPEAVNVIAQEVIRQQIGKLKTKKTRKKKRSIRRFTHNIISSLEKKLR